MKASNDHIIDQILNDDSIDIRPDGTIWTYRTIYGHESLTARPTGNVNCNGYLRIKYYGKQIFSHRIVWAKYKGKLDGNLNILHKDGDKTNNHPDNLEIGTQADSNTARYQVYGNPPVKGNYKPNLQEKAVKLRKKGLSVKEIESALNISRASASVWTKEVEYTEKEAGKIYRERTQDGRRMIETIR